MSSREKDGVFGLGMECWRKSLSGQEAGTATAVRWFNYTSVVVLVKVDLVFMELQNLRVPIKLVDLGWHRVHVCVLKVNGLHLPIDAVEAGEREHKYHISMRLVSRRSWM